MTNQNVAIPPPAGAVSVVVGGGGGGGGHHLRPRDSRPRQQQQQQQQRRRAKPADDEIAKLEDHANTTNTTTTTTTSDQDKMGSLEDVSEKTMTATLNSQELSQLTATELASQSRPNVITATNLDPLPTSHSEAGRMDQHQHQHQHQSQSQHQNQTTPGNQWLAAANQTRQGIGQRMSQASDQLSQSIRQLYASASSITDVPPSYHNIPGIVPYYHGRSVGPPPSYDDVINPYAPPPTYQSLFGQMREARKSSRGLVDLLRRLLIILVSTLGCTILIAFMILIPFTMIIIGAIYIDECHIEHIPAFLLLGGLVWASKNLIHCYGQCKQQEQQEAAAAAAATTTGLPVADIYQPSLIMSATGGTSPPPTISTINPTPTTTRSQQASQQASQQQQHQPPGPMNGRRLKSSICESLLNCVLFGWFIAGCVIVFRNYEPDFENSASARYCHRTVYMYTFWLITSALVSFGLFIGCICCLMVSSAVASRQDDLDLA